MKFLKKFQYNAPVVLTFAILAFVILWLGEMTGGRITNLLFVVKRGSLLNPLTYLRLFTHIFGHVNMEHYTGNILFILLIGPMLEEKYGSKLMIEMFVITALVTGIINDVFFTTGLCGASGIVFMMIILASMASVEEGRIPITLILTMVIYLGQEVYDGLFTTDNISHLGHIIGGICGMGFGYIYNRKHTTA